VRTTAKRKPIKTDPHVLLAIAEYLRDGLDRHAIIARLRISERTYYRCLEQIERRKASES
jgi:hypothetical protein